MKKITLLKHYLISEQWSLNDEVILEVHKNGLGNIIDNSSGYLLCEIEVKKAQKIEYVDELRYVLKLVDKMELVDYK